MYFNSLAAAVLAAAQKSRGKRINPQVANRAYIRSAFEKGLSDGGADEGAAERSQEVSSVVYKVGEFTLYLMKLWMEYKSSQSDKNGESTQNGPTLEIRIPAEHVTSTNCQVRDGQLWGTDIYTASSDLVAVLMHTGYWRPTPSPPPPAIQELRATIRILPLQDSYTSTLRNNVRSRAVRLLAWQAAITCCSYRVEHCCIVKYGYCSSRISGSCCYLCSYCYYYAEKGGETIDLEPCLTHTSAVEPTLAPVAAECTMTTRAAALNATSRQDVYRDLRGIFQNVLFKFCNEPWLKYRICIVAAKGLENPFCAYARLKMGDVLYLETQHSCRYELCFTGEKMVKATHSQMHEESDKSHNHQPHSSNGEKNDSDNVLIDVFRWSRCKKPLPQKVMRSLGIPLPLEYVEVLEENLDWGDVQWSQTGVWIADKEYTLARVHFLYPS